MYISYYDEAGDDGFPGSSPIFALTALYLHYSDWKDTYYNLKEFRKYLKSNFGIPIKMEFHTRHFLANKKPFRYLSLSDSDKIGIMDLFCDLIASMPINFINVTINKLKIKTPGYPILDNALKYSIQRIENHLGKINPSKRFIIITDPGREISMQKTSRRIQRINFIPSKIDGTSYRSEIKTLIEDPLPKASDQSYFIQLSDLVVTITYYYCLTTQKVARLPNRLPVGCNNKKFLDWMNRIKPSLNLDASGVDQFGVVIYPK